VSSSRIDCTSTGSEPFVERQAVAKWYRGQIDTVVRLDPNNKAGLRDRFTDLLNRAALRNEDDAFYD
jgi:hypothetical protein